MKILQYNRICFDYTKLIEHALKKKNNSKVTALMIEAAKSAFEDGMSLLDMRTIIEVYDKENSDEKGYITLSLPGQAPQQLYVGPRAAGLLIPATQIVVILSTVGNPIVEAIHNAEKNKEYLKMYYIDTFGVLALGEISGRTRAHIKAMAAKKGWGISPSVQPGAVEGWMTTGQSDLFRLAYGETIGLTINEFSFLVPNISNSTIIGLGPHYAKNTSDLMCEECSNFVRCLWRRENGNLPDTA